MSTNRMAKVSRLVPPRASQLLGECHLLTMKRVPDLLKGLLDKGDDTYFELANKADSSQRQQVYFDAMRELRLKRAQVENAFRASLKATFDACFEGATVRERPRAEFSEPVELSLVDSADVEQSLAATNFAESVKSRCKQELYALDRRIGHLLSDPNLDHAVNPFGPEAIAQALRALSQPLDIDIEARLTLLKLADRCFGPGLGELYRNLNEFLVREDVLPRMTTSAPRSLGSGRTRVTIETEDGVAEARGVDVFSTLEQLMRPGVPGLGLGTGSGGLPGLGGPGGVGLPNGLGAAGSPGGHGMPGVAGAMGGPGAAMLSPGAGGDSAGGGGITAGGALTPDGFPALQAGPLATGELLSNLTALQQGQPGQAHAWLDPGMLHAGTVNVLRALRESGAVGELNQTDHLTLDIVTLLFDYILDDPSIPDRIKALIGRLQIPLLKVALLDKELFSKKTHPARQLLDALAGAAVGWSADNAQSDALLEKIEYIVYRVVEEFDREMGLFSELLSELNAFLATDEREATERAERAANSLRTKERIVLAKLAVDEAVKGRLDGSETREFVVQFVRDYWRQQLIVTYVEQGPGSDAWIEQLGVIDDLVWSVSPKTTPDEKRELTTRLPKLLKALKAGMKELGMVPADCSKFLTMLASVHVVSVKNVEEASLAERRLTRPDDTGKPQSVTHEGPAEEAFVRQALDRLFARKSIEPAALDIDFSQLETEAAAEPEPEEEVPEDEFLEKVMELDLGDWVEFTLDDESSVRARFTWISPATGRYLFTDRQGRKAFDLTLAALCERFRAGKALRFAGQPDPLFERAINELMERMERQVA
ncbi:MAG: DUF1631 domain-containing protein [Gammaproteobacteria bacterium]